MLKFLSNYTIKSKVIFLFVINFLVLAGVGYVGMNALHSIGKEIIAIAEEDIPLTRNVTNITAHQLEQAVYFERAVRYAEIMQGNPHYQEKYKEAKKKFVKLSNKVDAEILEAEKVVAEILTHEHSAEITKEFQHVEKVLKGLEHSHHTFDEHVYDVFKMFESGQLHDALVMAEQVEAEEEKINHKVEELLFELVAFTEKAAKTAEHHEIEAYNQMQMLIIIGVAVSLLFSTIIILAITRPLTAMQTATDSMSKGNKAQIPSLDAKDEIGVIARSLKIIYDQGQAAVRVQTALENVKSNVMMADADLNIVFVNKAVVKMLRNAQEDIRKDLPNFNVDTLVGTNIDDFHKNPAHQRGMLKDLASAYESTLTIGGRIFDLVVNPVMNNEGERVGTVVEWNDVTIERQLEDEIAGVVAASAQGDFTKRLDTAGREGFFLKLCEGMNEIGEVSNTGLTEVKEVLQEVAQGNLTNNIKGNYAGLFDEIKQALNNTISQLLDMVGKIRDAADSVSGAAREISAGSQDLSHRTEEQASTLEETAASMEELTGTVRQNTDNAQNASHLSTEASDIASSGGEVVKTAVEAMERIQESSQKISDIIGTIDDIAFQTNLLALNAAVEAARAGEAGKGFAVVASEVRSLAGRSAAASKEIKGLISNSVEQVKTGAELVNKSGGSLEEIVKAVQDVAELIQGIAAASAEQSTGIEEVNSAVTQMDEATQQNAALVEESTAAAQSMTEQAYALTQLIGFFKTSAEELAAGNDQPLPDMPSSAAPAAKPAAKKAAPAPKPAPTPVRKAAPIVDKMDADWEEF